MSMNLTLYAVGEVIFPNNKKEEYSEVYPINQTRTVDTYHIMDLPEEKRAEEYAKLYFDDQIHEWIEIQKNRGLKIVWGIE